MSRSPLDANPYVWRLRGAAGRWWRALTTASAADGSGNLFDQPEIGGDRVELLPTIQPVLNVNPAELQFNPLSRGIALNTATGFKLTAARNMAEAEFPIYSEKSIADIIFRLYGIPNGSLHALAYLARYSFAFFDDSGDRPDFNKRLTINLSARLDSTFRFSNGQALLFETMAGVRTPNSSDDLISGVTSDVLVPAGSPPTGFIYFASSNEPAQWDYPIWAVFSTTIIVYPASGVPREDAVAPEAVSFTDVTPA